ncbi:hypothetical protein BGZ81_003040 [Podila clonocystis]|nr:hypothetical protein BGZ81_003040 [Podila clonocystis]
MNILHRDIKAANCLITHDNYLKLADFGAAKTDSVYHSGRTYVGTPGYIAPEVRRNGQSYGKEADMFSAGGVLFHLYTTREPQEGEDLLADENQLPHEFKSLIWQLRHPDSTQRPSAGSLLHGAPGILRYRMDELQVELTEKNEKIKELDNRNASLMRTVQQLRVEVEDKRARIKLLEPAAGPYVYRPLVFDKRQTLEEQDQVRSAWKVGFLMGAD